MTKKQKQWIACAIVVVAILIAVFLVENYPIPAPPATVAAPPATVAPQSFIYPPGAIYFAEGGKSQVFQDGSSATYNSGAQLTASSGSTVTLAGTTVINGGLALDTDKFVIEDGTGQVAMSPIADSTLTDYDNWLQIQSSLTGLGTKDRVYGLDIELTRPAGYGTTNGDHDDAGIKVRMTNKAVTNTAGTVLRGMDLQVKNDNPNGSITELSGATLSIKTDTDAGDVGTATAMKAEISADAAITTSLIVGDFRNFRQAATEPTTEYGVQIRNGNTSGTGIDAGLMFKSEAATVGAFDYAIDMNGADINTADLRLSQGETIDNLMDGTVNIGGTSPVLAVGGVSFTGPMKYGVSATYVSSAAITHGFAVTPTA